MARRFPGTLDAGRITRARTMWDFDDSVTAPLHGFTGADDYWMRASSKPWLSEVRVPTLVLNARNDPFVPARSLPASSEVSSDVVLEQPDTGGHVGFMTGPAPGRIDWLPRRILRFFDDIDAGRLPQS
jgi:predicted alpha/beta-fold hydrolase